MWSAVLLLLTTQTPSSAAVLVTSKRPGADAPAKAVAARVTKAATAAGFAVQADAASAKALKAAKLNARDCQGATPCLQKLASAVGAVVFGVDVGKIGDSLAIHLEAVNATESLGAVDVPVDGDLKSADLSALDAFAKSVADKTAPSTPSVAEAPRPPEPTKPAPADAPKAAALEPTPSSPPSATVAAKPPPPGRSGFRKALPWIVGVGAVAALGVGGAFLGMGAGEKSKFDASVSGGISRLPGSELQALSARGNLDFTIGFSTAAAGVGLAALAALLFAL